MKVPLLDLEAHHSRLRTEIDAAIRRVLDKGAFCGGPFVEDFEEAFAAFCGAAYAVGVGSGTDALWLTLLALDIGPGDEVITVPNTFIATAEAISMTGASPVFVDVDPLTYGMDPMLVEAAITPRTKAILPVHLYGHPVDMDPILQVARAHALPVVEDACQAHGALYWERTAGAIGTAGCFSFYPSKNLGAFGEAGAILTSDPALYQRLKELRNHGQQSRDNHMVVGWNARMDGIQGAVLRVKLRYLPEFISGRRRCAALYNAMLHDVVGVIGPTEATWARHVYHVYAIRTLARGALMATLRSEGIECRVHYPVPIHLQPAYHGLGYGRGSFPVAERVVNEVVSLPIYPEISRAQVARVAEVIAQHRAEAGVPGRVPPRIVRPRPVVPARGYSQKEGALSE